MKLINKFLRRVRSNKYTLIVRNVGGDIRMRVIVTTEMSKIAHSTFLACGFNYYRGVGYLYRDGTVAEAYCNNKFISYPEWIEGDDDE